MIASDWVGMLPVAWSAKPLRAVASFAVSNVDKVPVEGEIPVRLCNYSDVYNNEFITDSLHYMRATATQEEIAKFGLRVNDVLITKDSESWDDIGIPALVRKTADDLVCGYHLAIIRPNTKIIHGEFLLRCLQAKQVRLQLELAANGVTRFGIPKSEIGAMRLPLPSLPNQIAIVQFLDIQISRLDALVAAKDRLVLFLLEKRQSLINHSVTRGLDSQVIVRDSGVSWLGDIPADWKTRRTAWLFRERDERGEPELPLLEVSIKSGVILRQFSDDRIESVAADFSTYKVARKGDIVFNKMRMWQGAVGVAPEDGLVSPDYVVATPNEELLPEYAGLLFRTGAFSAECARHSHGIVWDRLRLYWEGFREIVIPLPPLEIQAIIVAHIENETSMIDGVRSANEKTVQLLKERRAAIIAATVTGQIDADGSV